MDCHHKYPLGCIQIVSIVMFNKPSPYRPHRPYRNLYATPSRRVNRRRKLACPPYCRRPRTGTQI